MCQFVRLQEKLLEFHSQSIEIKGRRKDAQQTCEGRKDKKRVRKSPMASRSEDVNDAWAAVRAAQAPPGGHT